MTNGEGQYPNPMHRREIGAGSWLLVLLILLYFAAAVGLAMRLPAHATPNELLNYEYIQVMLQIKALPNRGLVDSEVRYTEWHQPPLYFLFAAVAGLSVPVPAADSNPPPPIRWPANPAYLGTPRGNLNPVVHVTPQAWPLLYTSRISASLLGILGVAALFRTGRVLYSPAIGLLMASLLAFQPNYMHLSASVNNDMPLASVSALVLAYTLLIIYHDRPPIWYLGLGLLAAAAILTKANGVFVLAYLGAAWLAVFWRHRDVGRTVRSALYSLLGLIPLWAAWLAFNAVRMKDALGVEGSLPVDRVLALRPADFVLLWPWLGLIWRSFWLDWSSGDVGFGPDWFYLLWALFLALALFGWLRRPPERDLWPGLLIVGLGMLAISYLYFAVKALTVKETGWLVPEGRWWLPVMPGLAWLAGAGFGRWWPPEKRDKAALAAAALPILSTYLLFLFYFPALYPHAQRISPAGSAIEEPAVAYDARLALLTAEVGPLTEGEMGEALLTWQALADIEENLLVGLQLLVPTEDGWRKLDEQYSYPGLGQNPTEGWLAGEIYADRWTLRPSGDLPGPVAAQLAVQVQANGDKLPATASGQIVDPPLPATAIVRPREPLVVRSPLAGIPMFGAAIELAGFESEQDGDDLLVTLWWRTTALAGGDYTVFIHALDQQGQVITQSDATPAGGASPTGIWQPGDVVRDKHRLIGGGKAAALRIGLYEPASGRRLDVMLDGQTQPTQAFELRLGSG
ncbi:MAG: ArnT family glycosyltransferase [Candidatus Promineifilaceae bacterium]